VPPPSEIVTLSLHDALPILTRESADTAACYGVFRRYLFDYRAELTLPLLLLVDAQGRAHKIYPGLPGAESLRRDLRFLQDPDRLDRKSTRLNSSHGSISYAV